MPDFPRRHVLTNVPKVEFYSGGPRCPEDIPFPSVMRSLMEYYKSPELGCRFRLPMNRGCRTRCAYSFFIAVSGIASFLNWKPGWEGDNVEIMYMSDDPEAPFRNAFAAIGYTYKILGSDSDPGSMKEAIIASINNGNPVIAFGPIGPPESALITGYDENGDILIGWSFFQNIPPFNTDVEFEPSGEFRKKNWNEYECGFSCLTIDEKKSMPSLDSICKRTFEWMVTVARTPVTFRDRANGFAAYDAWASQLVEEPRFPDDNDLLMQRFESHNNVIGFLAEARWYGSQFLIGLTENGDDIIHRDSVEDIYHAAALYAGEHQLMWELWNLAGGNGNPNGWRYFAERQNRIKMASIIKQAKEKDIAATKHIEAALSRMK